MLWRGGGRIANGGGDFVGKGDGRGEIVSGVKGWDRAIERFFFGCTLSRVGKGVGGVKAKIEHPSSLVLDAH